MTISNIGVISDAHNSVSAIQEALQTFDDYEVDRIIYCGDVTDPETIACFRGYKIDFVLGNCDECRRSAIVAAIKEIGGICHDLFGEIEWGGKKIFFTHGHRNDVLENAIYSGQYDLVCYGHTHVYEERKYENTLIVNPGALQYGGSYCVIGNELEVDRFDVQS